MKKAINTLATIIAVVMSFAITTPLGIGGMWLIGYGLKTLFAFDYLNLWQTLLILILLLPSAGFWAYMVGKIYFKVISKINQPFITLDVEVFNQ